MKFEDWIEQLTDWRWRREQQEFAWNTFFLGVLFVGGFYIGGPVLIGWFIWKQVRLEQGFYDRYGQHWQAEYQKYHGSLAQAHLKIAVCVVALISIITIGFWFYRQVHRKKNHVRRRNLA